MVRLATIMFAAFTSAALHAEPQNLLLAGNPVEGDDPEYQEAEQIIHEQPACFKREALSKSIAKVDLLSAAYAVVGRRAVQTERYKALRARYFQGNVSKFEQWWSQEQADDLEFVKKLIAVIRTSK